MIDKVAKIVEVVQSLRATAYPCRAVILDALAALSVDRLAEIIERRELSEDDVRLVADKTGHHPLAISDVMRDFVRFDCADYEMKYANWAVQSCPANANSDVKANLGWLKGDGLIHFLLHDTICCWNPRESKLGKGIIIEDDRESLLTRCYLIQRGFAFPTTLDVLRNSCQQDWPNWRALWKYF